MASTSGRPGKVDVYKRQDEYSADAGANDGGQESKKSPGHAAQERAIRREIRQDGGEKIHKAGEQEGQRKLQQVHYQDGPKA